MSRLPIPFTAPFLRRRRSGDVPQAADERALGPGRRLALAGAALLVIIGGAVGVDEAAWRGAHAAAVGSAVSGAVRTSGAIFHGAASLDLAAIFAARSPGDRSGPLQQTKPDRVAAATHTPPPPLDGPEERVLASIRERPAEPELAPPDAPPPLIQTLPRLASTAPASAPPGPPVPFNPGPSVLSNLPPPELFAPNTPGSPGQPPGGGPPTGGGPPPGGGTPPPTSPVPEPSAWMLMITSLFGLGLVLRRRRAKDRTALEASGGSRV